MYYPAIMPAKFPSRASMLGARHISPRLLLLLPSLLSISLSHRSPPPHPRLILTAARAAEVRALAASTDPFALDFVARTRAQAAWANASVHAGALGASAGDINGRTLIQALYSLSLGAALEPPGSPAGASLRASAARVALRAAGASEFDPNGTVALNTGEVLHGLGLALDWLYDALNATERAAVVAGIVGTGLARVRAALSASPPAWAVSFVSTQSNWNTVILSGTIIACLAVSGEPGAPAWVDSLRGAALENLIAWSVRGWAPSGAWPEGPNYGGYTMRYLVPLTASLLTATGSDGGIRAAAGVLSAPRWLAAVVVPTRPAPELYYYFDARPFPETIASYLAVAAWAGDAPAAASVKAALSALAPFIPVDDGETTAMNAPLALLYYTSLGAPGEQAALPLVARFRGVEVVTARSSWLDENATFIAFKGLNTTGNWAHTHLDASAFVFATHGQWFAQDIGSDSYSAPGYFSASRFNLYRTNVSGHNAFSFSGHNPQCIVEATYQANCTPALITVFNETAPAAATLLAPAPPPAAAAAAAAAPFAVDAFAVVDLTAGLEHLHLAGLRRVQRGFIVGGGRTQLVTVDEVDFGARPDNAAPIPDVWWTLHTVANISLSADGAEATLTTSNVSVAVTVEYLAAASDCPGAHFAAGDVDLLPPLLDSPGLRVLRLAAPALTCRRIVVAVGVAPPGVGLGVRPLAEWAAHGPLLAGGEGSMTREL